MRCSLLSVLIFIAIDGYAQDDSAKSINVSAYIDMYYSYDFSKPNNFEKPDFNYNYKKHNQFDVNLAFVKASYQTKRIRSNGIDDRKLYQVQFKRRAKLSEAVVRGQCWI